MAITFASGAYIDKSGAVTDWDLNAGSFCLWFRRSGRPAGNAPVIQGKTSSALGSAAGINVYLNVAAGADQDKLGIQIKNNSGSQANSINCAPQIVFDGNWHLASMDWNQTGSSPCNLYLDGGNKATANNSFGWAWVTQGIRYARSVDSFWGSFDGQLAHSCWWNVQLTAMEHYLLGCGAHPLTINPGAIIMYLPMDDAAVVRDYGPRIQQTITTSGTLTRSLFEPPLGPADMGFLMEKGTGGVLFNSSAVRRQFKAFRTRRI